jgi:antitoxin YefM
MLETVTANEAENDIQDLIDAAAESHRPILITTETNNAVLLAVEDWNALQETVHLLSSPALRESIINAMDAPDEEFLTEEKFLNELEKTI